MFVLGLLGAVMQAIVYFLVVALKLYTTDIDTGLLTSTISSAPAITLMLKMMSIAITQLEVNVRIFLPSTLSLSFNPPSR